MKKSNGEYFPEEVLFICLYFKYIQNIERLFYDDC